MSIDDEEELKHPSYGLASITRTSGGPRRLFGSSLDNHYTTFRINISPAVWKRSPYGDRFYGPLRGEMIEIELSSQQFADFITTHNIGCGIPCTIRYFDGAAVDAPPEAKTQAENIKAEFTKKFDDYTARDKQSQAAVAEIKALTAKLPKAAQRRIEIGLEIISEYQSANAKYALERFDEATQQITSAAKAEVDAFTSHVIQMAGLEAIAEGRVPKALSGAVAPMAEGGGGPTTSESTCRSRESVAGNVCMFALACQAGECVGGSTRHECYDGCGACDGCGVFLALDARADVAP
jgi:hypothetical protein